MAQTVPSSEPTCQHVSDLLALVATIRAHAFDVSVPPAESLIDIRGCAPRVRGEFLDQE
jgi:hypothetical protein